MEPIIITLTPPQFLLINGPLIFFNLTANIFYSCCLIFPPRNRSRLKQLLKLLLGLLVWCSCSYWIALTLVCFGMSEKTSYNIFLGAWLTALSFVHGSMTLNVWLNFYYYTQIVPAKRALFIWVKRNITVVICMALLFDGFSLLFCGAVDIVQAIYIGRRNVTVTDREANQIFETGCTCFYIVETQLLICLGVTTVSSFSTARYLHGHMRHLKQTDSSFTTPRLQSQMRVTITGICQGVIYFLYNLYLLFVSFNNFYSSLFIVGNWITFTVISLYITVVTISLGIGQSTFRERAADVWEALKTLFCVGTVTQDVRSSQLTSDRTASTVDVQLTL